MKKTFLLLYLMTAFAISAVAQSNNVPKPLNPEITEWIDYNPVEFPDGQWVIQSQLGITWGQDVMGNLVADDYNLDIDTCWTEGPCQYTMLDKDKFSFSIYTDLNKIYTFTPDKYEEFSEPVSDVPFSFMEGLETGGTYPHFEYWYVHFEETNKGEESGIPRFFKWRIGIQTHYTVDGVTNSSDIIYWDVNKWGDTNNDGDVNVNDVTVLIGMILGQSDKSILADLNDDGEVEVNDVTMLINFILGKITI